MIRRAKWCRRCSAPPCRRWKRPSRSWTLKDLNGPADYLHRARQRDFYGLGGSAQIARDVSHKFLRIGIRTSVFDDAHMMMMSAALLTPDDVAVAYSHSGTTSAVIEALELAAATARGRSR